MKNKEPCIKCKHLKLDNAAFMKLRIDSDIIKRLPVACLKNKFLSSAHNLRFLTKTIKQHKEGGDHHIANCEHYETKN